MIEGYTIAFLEAERVASKFLTGGDCEQVGLSGMLSEPLTPLKCYKFKRKQKNIYFGITLSCKSKKIKPQCSIINLILNRIIKLGIQELSPAITVHFLHTVTICFICLGL